jgi:hypothetical protein
MTRHDQRIMARAHILIPDEDVTELAPDDLTRITELEAALNKMTDIVIALALLLASFIALFLFAWGYGIIRFR